MNKSMHAIKDKEKKSSKVVNIAVPKFSLPRTSNGYLIVVLLIFAFLLGMLTNKVLYLENAQKSGTGGLALIAPSGDTAQAPEAIPTEDLSPKKVSIDDDPILGDQSAKVTMIDFTDYECPFCKRYFDETFEQIKKDYIDTGKVKYVVRDLPLNFHENAPKEAEAAECAREQGGDTVYFQYHDEIFKRTTSNGTGLALDQLAVIATDLGLDGVALQACLDTDTYKAEVEKDLADAEKVGATGTPSFFIGKSSSDGIITGTPLIGAQPYNLFKAELDKQLQ